MAKKKTPVTNTSDSSANSSSTDSPIINDESNKKLTTSEDINMTNSIVSSEGQDDETKQSLPKNDFTQDADELKRVIKEKDKTIESLKTKLDELQAPVDQLVKKLIDKERTIATLGQKVKDLDNTIKQNKMMKNPEQMQAILKKTEQDLKSAQSFIQKKEQTIAELDEMIQSKDHYISSLEQTIREKGKYATELERALTDKDEYNTSLRADVVSREEYLSSLKWTIEQKDIIISDLEKEISEIRREINDISNSRAFRILRSVGGILDKISGKGSEVRRIPKKKLKQSSSGIILFCDRPDFSSDIGKQGRLIVEGWAISRKEAIKEIQIFFDENSIGNAEYGLSRPDVADEFADVISSPNCGFRHILDISDTNPGSHKLKIVAQDTNGNSESLEGIINVTEGQTVTSDVIAKEEKEDSPPVICTIVSKNYLSLARVLTESFLEHHPSGKVYLLLADEVDDYFDPAKEKFELVSLQELEIKDLPSFTFKYTVIELNTAVKPYLLEYLFNKKGVKKVAYFDPDIFFTNKLDKLFNLLDQYSIVLTPHILHPYEDLNHPSEVTILQSGTFNLGFIAVANSHITRNFLHWWQDKVYDGCVMDPERGYHVDQKWIDLAPSFFESVYVLREPGYNVAYWNLNGRKITQKDGSLYVNSRPLFFYHFSGFHPDNIDKISKHQNRFTLKDLPSVKPLFEKYRELVLAAGYNEVKAWPYAFGYFDNGIKIPDISRSMYRSLGEKARIFENPFDTANHDSFFNWLNSNVDKNERLPISRLWYEIYRSRGDLLSAFPDIFGMHRESFLDWTVKSGLKEHQLDKAFLKTTHISQKTLEALSSKSILDGLKEASINYVKSRLVPQPRSPTMIDRKLEMGINLAGYFTGEFGVAEDARSFAFSLQDANIPHVLINIESEVHRNRDFTFQKFSESNPYPINIIRVNADQVPVFFNKKGPYYGKGKYNIGVWAWELPQFPEEWKSSFNYFQELWAISNFIAESLGKVSPIPVIKISYPFRVDTTNVVADKAKFGLDDDRFTFLFMFDYLSIFQRKNPLALVKAFNEAFSQTDKVSLALKSINSKFDQQNAKLLREEISKNKNIKLLDGHMEKAEVKSLMASCDCYTSMHRSEGLGITMAEAMYLEKPVIATGFSGNMDFMNVNNSHLIRYNVIELEKDYSPYKKGYTWADPDIGHASELMRKVYQNQEEAKMLGKKASEYLKQSFNPHVTGKEIQSRISNISLTSNVVV